MQKQKEKIVAQSTQQAPYLASYINTSNLEQKALALLKIKNLTLMLLKN
ncbi:hypothetical protein [Bartonella schoenbuchensis]